MGSEETIPALFGIISKPNTGSLQHIDPEGETPRKPTTRKLSQQSPNIPAQPVLRVVNPEKIEVAPTMENLTKAMEEFRKTYKAVNDKTNKLLPDHEQDIEKRNKSIQQSA